MAKSVLVGCFEVPGWGGASTSAYQLYKKLKADSLDATYVNLVSPDDATFFRLAFGAEVGNPEGAPGVHNCFLSGSDYTDRPELRTLIDEVRPDVMLGIGWIAAFLLKHAAPKTKLIFLTTGSEQAKTLISTGRFKDFVALERYLRASGNHLGTPAAEEAEAFGRAELVVVHSEMNLFLHDQFFERARGKIHRAVIWFAEWICSEAQKHAEARRDFVQRDVDLLFIASSWKRPEKNYPLVRRLLSRFRGLRIHIVGEVEERLEGVKYHGFLSQRDAIFALLGRSKTVVCPSSFDTAPGILFEAAVMGCNLVASKNCGNWQICNQKLLAAPSNSRDFERKIALSLANKFDDNLGDFLEGDPYGKLKEVISIL